MLRGASDGLARTAQADSFWAAAGIRVGVEVPLSDVLRLRAFGDAEALLTRTTLVVDDRPVWTTPSLAFALGLGAVVELH